LSLVSRERHQNLRHLPDNLVSAIKLSLPHLTISRMLVELHNFMSNQRQRQGSCLKITTLVNVDHTLNCLADVIRVDMVHLLELYSDLTLCKNAIAH